MSEALTFTEHDGFLRYPSPGITLEHSPSAANSNENIERGNFESLTLVVIAAADLAMRSNPDAKALRARISEISSEISGTDARMNTHVTPQGYMGLTRLSARLSAGLCNTQQTRPYNKGSMGMPDGGLTFFGDRGASYGFDYSSPLNGETGEHWYKKTFQLISDGHNTLTVGALERTQTLKQVPFMDALTLATQKSPFTIRVAEKQPPIIPELSFDHDNYSKLLPAAVDLQRLGNYLEAITETQGLTYSPLKSRSPSRHGASAGGAVIDAELGIGLRMNLRSHSPNYDTELRYLQSEDSIYTVVDEEDGQVRMRSHSFSVTPIVATRNQTDELTWSSEYRQDSNVLPRRLYKQAEAMGAIVLGIKDAILNQPLSQEAN